MTTLVTGASGFVGAAVARQLLAQGHEVRALVRPGGDRRNLQGLALSLVEGDLGDPDSLRRAVAGCEWLFHIAADYRLWVPDPQAMLRVNVAGTETLLQRAGDAGVKRIIYTSSVAALGLNQDRSPADEETPTRLKNMIGHYKRSKFIAEQAVRKLVATQGLPVVIVNPAAPLGPRDVKPTPTGRIVLDTLRGKMPAYVQTGLNVVHVDDVAQGHLLAFEKGAPGERYILGGENMTLKAILDEVCACAGLAPPRIRLPRAALYPVAWLAEGWAKLSGATPPVTVDSLRMAGKFMHFSSAKARQALGYRPRPARQAIEDAVAWFRDNGYC